MIIVKPVAAEVVLVNTTPQTFGSNTGGSTSIGGVPGHDVYVRVFNPSNTAVVLLTRYGANNAALGSSPGVALGSVSLGPLNTEYFALSKNEFLGSNAFVNAAPVAILGV